MNWFDVKLATHETKNKNWENRSEVQDKDNFLVVHNINSPELANVNNALRDPPGQQEQPQNNAQEPPAVAAHPPPENRPQEAQPEWNEECDRFSFEDSDRFEEDSLCSWSSEPESLCNNWRGWKRPAANSNFGNGCSSKKQFEGKYYRSFSFLPFICISSKCDSFRKRNHIIWTQSINKKILPSKKLIWFHLLFDFFVVSLSRGRHRLLVNRFFFSFTV